MMRPTVSVYSTKNADEVTGEMTLPTVFCTPLR
jgi:predicted transcriptional regulator